MDMATRVRVARQRAGMTQSQLAERIGVSRGAVANWEVSQRPKPSASNLVEVATTTEVSVEWLATGRGEIALPR
ncbi:helix-turn-helix transcriptional regulator [Pseudoxanthomonas beigongshangi]|uniref:helix-turn-helix transcriptional regulator n=1 Tax=Pseudoxanthomonas beigongshangi TaxID=2782537 RepID=UPI00193B75E8|nr:MULTISPECIES: helix-turn-helix transcriptional regulator [Pseudoxanthomonas]